MSDADLKNAGWNPPRFIFGDSGVSEMPRLQCPVCGSKEMVVGPVTVDTGSTKTITHKSRVEVYETAAPSGISVQLNYSCKNLHEVIYSFVSFNRTAVVSMRFVPREPAQTQGDTK